MKKQEAKEQIIKDLNFEISYHNEKLETAKAKMRFVNDTPDQMDREEILIYIKNRLDNDNFGEFVRQISELVKTQTKIN